MKQVNIGKIKNDSQDWKSLIKMSKEVSGAIIRRSTNNSIPELDKALNI